MPIGRSTFSTTILTKFRYARQVFEEVVFQRELLQGFFVIAQRAVCTQRIAVGEQRRIEHQEPGVACAAQSIMTLYLIRAPGLVLLCSRPLAVDLQLPLVCFAPLRSRARRLQLGMADCAHWMTLVVTGKIFPSGRANASFARSTGDSCNTVRRVRGRRFP